MQNLQLALSLMLKTECFSAKIRKKTGMSAVTTSILLFVAGFTPSNQVKGGSGGREGRREGRRKGGIYVRV